MLQISHPRPFWKRILGESSSYEVIAALCAAGIAILSAWRFISSAPSPLLGALCIVLAVGVFAATLLKISMQNRDKIRSQSPDDLLGCLHTLHAILTTGIEENQADPCLRFTIHKVIEEGDKIEQLLEYVGDDRTPNGIGRKFRAACGITGKAIKSKDFIVAKRENDDYSFYLKKLVATQDYRDDEAKKLDKATMSWAAMPMFDEEKVFALLYCDATIRDFFTEERQSIIRGATLGIARFVKQRYNH